MRGLAVAPPPSPHLPLFGCMVSLSSMPSQLLKAVAPHERVYGRPQPPHVTNFPKSVPCPHFLLYKTPHRSQILIKSFTTFIGFSSLAFKPNFSSLISPNNLLYPKSFISYNPTKAHKMCSSKLKLQGGTNITPTIANINGRPVLQPTCNQVSSLERRNSVKKSSPKIPSPPSIPSPPPPPTHTANTKAKPSLSPPISPKLKSPRPPALKRNNDPNGLNSRVDIVLTPRCSTKPATSIKRSKRPGGVGAASSVDTFTLKYCSSMIVEVPGSIAAARREQVAMMQEQRKIRTAHYGRTNSAKYEGKVAPLGSSSGREEKRCTFITPNSDPIYVAYHDEEWGVPVHDDKLLFELLVLTAAQVGSDWTSILKKRQLFRDAFSGFDAEIVARLTEKKIMLISADYGIELSQVRGVVDNSNRILETKREFGSFNKYLWGFVNHKPISTQYKSCHKIPVKTSKSETISKDMVRRAFRFVGPTVIHSFMQAAGLTNDHLITCQRHLQCIALATHLPTAAPAL